jgi:hypothetical protein
MAKYLVKRGDEYGGIIYDFANGRMNLIHEWDTDKGVDEGVAIVEQMITGSRDEVYITVVKGGYRKGYFMVEHTGMIFPWMRAFWEGIYDPDEAFVDTMKKARECADKLGFRRPEKP